LVASALLLGAGVVFMHYVGIHGLAGDFQLEHQPLMVVLAALIAAGTAYGGLRILLAKQVGTRLALSAVAFGFAVSGMHYTAMYGMRFVPVPGLDYGADSLVVSPQMLALVVSLPCFLIAAGFLLFLVPETRGRAPTPPAGAEARELASDEATAPDRPTPRAGLGLPHGALPLRGLGQPRAPSASRVPVEGADGTHFIEAGDVRSIRADAHYTHVHDGSRERMCPWSISKAESQLDLSVFMRVHRSHIVALPHVALIRKEGDGAVVELSGSAPHLVPVSRARIAELRARLGLPLRQAGRPGALPRNGQSA
jgi:hypothetical protein